MNTKLQGPQFRKWIKKFPKHLQDGIIFDLSVGKEVPDAPKDHSYGSVAAHYRLTEPHKGHLARKEALRDMIGHEQFDLDTMSAHKVDKLLYFHGNSKRLLAEQKAEIEQRIRDSVVLNLSSEDLSFYSRIPGKEWYKMLPAFTKSRYDRISDVYGFLNVPYIDPEVFELLPSKIVKSIVSNTNNREYIHGLLHSGRHEALDYKAISSVVFADNQLLPPETIKPESRPASLSDAVRPNARLATDESNATPEDTSDLDEAAAIAEYERLKKALMLTGIRPNWNLTSTSTDQQQEQTCVKSNLSAGLKIHHLSPAPSPASDVALVPPSPAAVERKKVKMTPYVQKRHLSTPALLTNNCVLLWPVFGCRCYVTRAVKVSKNPNNIKRKTSKTYSSKTIIQDMRLLTSGDNIDSEFVADPGKLLAHTGKYTPKIQYRLEKVREGPLLDEVEQSPFHIEDMHQKEALRRAGAACGMDLMNKDPFNLSLKAKMQSIKTAHSSIHKIDVFEEDIKQRQHAFTAKTSLQRVFSEQELATTHPNYLDNLNNNPFFKELILAQATQLHTKYPNIYTEEKLVQIYKLSKRIIKKALRFP